MPDSFAKSLMRGLNFEIHSESSLPDIIHRHSAKWNTGFSILSLQRITRSVGNRVHKRVGSLRVLTLPLRDSSSMAADLTYHRASGNRLLTLLPTISIWKFLVF